MRLDKILQSYSFLLLGAFGQTAVCQTSWPAYNNTLDSQRFSPLTQINKQSVADLKEACELALGDDGSFESGPVVIGDTLYVTTVNTLVALSAADCSLRWRYQYIREEEEGFLANRGVAYGNGRVFRGTADGRLLALDARTGRELWRVKAADPTQGESISAAPISWRGMLFIGPAGSDRGIRGRMTAFDAATGKEVWRFNTIPTGHEPGAETWMTDDDTLKRGGGTWGSYTLDSTSGELFIAVGNPAPVLNPELRPGANLYTDSLVVLDAKSGRLKWYYQLRANDGFDWDAGAAPLLYQEPTGRSVVALGGKDGFVYAIDRHTHRLLFKTAVTTILNADRNPTPEGIRACPGPEGGVEWNGPAYSPLTRYLYAGATDRCSVFRSTFPTYNPPKPYIGTSMQSDESEPKSGWITALDSRTGSVMWKYHTALPSVSGVTPTASGLVFAGDLGGNLLALDSSSGAVLLNYNMQGGLAGGIITYMVRGRQYLAVAAGSRSKFAVPGTPRLVVLTTGLGSEYRASLLTVAAASQPKQ